ncbi:cytidine deaminase [Yunchengibacter salinarum]|uniref:cytidine deaminase n=1 Tax=Yunchengibacter salinarum TaxID=3133399 RepID=UPI0035B591A8
MTDVSAPDAQTPDVQTPDAETRAAMVKAACTARGRAYAPYSRHPVGAAVLDEQGAIHAGCNVENAAFPLGTCAEAAAISAMVLAGGRRVVHVVVAGPGAHVCTPCGGCRQKIREFAPSGAGVTMVDDAGATLLETDSAALLPHSFGPDNLPG